MGLQSNETENENLRKILSDIEKRVRSMAMLHEKLCESSNFSCVEFSEYARTLMEFLWHSHGSDLSGVRRVPDLDPVALAINLEVPCGLILNELVTNSLKHAFPEGHAMKLEAASQ